MTKQQIISGLTYIRNRAETHDNAAIRADMVETIDKLTSAIEAMPEPEAVDLEFITEDWRIARRMIHKERNMRNVVFADRSESFRRNKIAECTEAGRALDRVAAAAGVKTPELAPRVPQMHQAPLIERGKAEVMA